MAKRRLIIRNVNGSVITHTPLGKPTPHFEIDLTDWPNGSARDPLMAEIQTQCNLGHWHKYDSVALPLWDDKDAWKSDDPKIK